MKPGECPSPWKNPQILLTLLLVFLCGSAAGALSMRYSVRAATSGKGAPSITAAERELTVERFKRELDLSSDQAKEVAEVLDDFAKYYQMLQAQMDEVRASGKDRITSILTPEQQEKFKKMMSELQSRQIR